MSPTRTSPVEKLGGWSVKRTPGRTWNCFSRRSLVACAGSWGSWRAKGGFWSVSGSESSGGYHHLRNVSTVTRAHYARFDVRLGREACCGAHHLGRVLREQGHEIKLMSPEYVHPSSSRHRRLRRRP